MLSTLGRNGFSSYQLLVADGSLGLLISPPTFPQSFDTRDIRLIVDLREDGVDVGRQGVGQTPAATEAIARLAWDDRTTFELGRIVGRLLAERRRANIEQPAVAVFRAEPQVPMSSLLQVMNAVSGRHCDASAIERGDRYACHFVERVIEAGPSNG